MHHSLPILKDDFIQTLIDSKKPVFIEFHNGIHLKGFIIGFENGMLQFHHHFVERIYLSRILKITPIIDNLFKFHHSRHRISNHDRHSHTQSTNPIYR